MSGICLMCGEPWRTHGTACRQRDIVPTEDTDHADDDFQTSRLRRIVREELERAKEKP